jgi:hypothetical protein
MSLERLNHVKCYPLSPPANAIPTSVENPFTHNKCWDGCASSTRVQVHLPHMGILFGVKIVLSENPMASSRFGLTHFIWQKAQL